MPFAASHIISWVILAASPFVILKYCKDSPAAVFPFRDAIAVGFILAQFDLAWVLQITALSADISITQTATLQSTFVALSAFLGMTSLLYFCFLQSHVRRVLCTKKDSDSSEETGSPETKNHTSNGTFIMPATIIVDESFAGRESGVLSKVAEM
jgi:hypothetical protein